MFHFSFVGCYYISTFVSYPHSGPEVEILQETLGISKQ